MGDAVRQYAALPWRMTTSLEILLVTSRETGRWVIPKGWPIKGKTPSASAAQEAREEAGVVGEVAKSALGAYNYVKFLANGEGQPCKVRVFPLKVVDQLEDWPEKHQRIAKWFLSDEAAAAVQEPGLARIIRKAEGRLG